MAKPRVVVVGNGMAGWKFVEELVAIAPGKFEVTVIGDEPQAAYNRVLLGNVLSGDVTPAACALSSVAWYESHEIALRLGIAATNIDARNRRVTLQDGHTISFDFCVLAMGSHPVRLNIPGAERAGIHAFRTLADVEALGQIVSRNDEVVVIGGGVLGIETAYALKCSGADVTLVHIMDRLMERQLDHQGAQMLRASIEARGIKVRLQCETTAFDGDDRVRAVELKSGEKIAASAVVLAVGIRPNTGLAAAARLKVNRGIVVDDQMRTRHRKILAIGECAEHEGTCYGLVEPCYEQARVAARSLAGRSDASFVPSALSTQLKVADIPVFSCGTVEGHEHIVLHDPVAGIYRKFVVADDALKGAVLVGDTSDAPWYRDLIRAASPISHVRQTLAFGRRGQEAA